MSYHARLSPSSASRWTLCTASPAAQDGIANENSDASRDGTCCHQISEELLVDPTRDIQDYLGREMWFAEGELRGEYWGRDEWPHTDVMPDAVVTVTQEMLDHVAAGVGFVRQLHELHGGVLEAEQRVPIGQFTGEEGAGGTTDVTITGDTWKIIVDFKYGRSKVTAYDVLVPAHEDIITGEVVPEKVRANLQMACYALGSIEKDGLLSDVQTVTMCIVQPPINHVSEYTCSIEELREVEAFLRAKADETRNAPVFVPDVEGCHFCRASGACEAQDAFIYEQATTGLDDGLAAVRPKTPRDVELGTKYALIPLLTDWCKAVAERVYQALQRDEPVVREDGLSYKLVAGKKGNRAWADEAEALHRLKNMRLTTEEIYAPRVPKTPTQLAELAKPPKVKKGQAPIPPVIGKVQWARIEKLIVQSDGKPTIALSTDPRPAVASVTDGFDDAGAEPNSDLF